MKKLPIGLSDFKRKSVTPGEERRDGTKCN